MSKSWQTPDAVEAKKAIRRIYDEGEVKFIQHAMDEMAKDRLTTADCLSVLRAGVVDPPEWEHGCWRYHVRTNRMCLIVELALDEPDVLVVVTAWRIK